MATDFTDLHGRIALQSHCATITLKSTRKSFFRVSWCDFVAD